MLHFIGWNYWNANKNRDLSKFRIFPLFLGSLLNELTIVYGIVNILCSLVSFNSRSSENIYWLLNGIVVIG